MSVPLTQNTAPVLEFNCLYTHDSRKKQKKWQDGFLRYHTFNKRVMVYDGPRNFIGDMHWAGEHAVQDGDELTLERGGVMVEVGESIGQTETDLTELRRSKHKATAAVHSQTPMRVAQTPRAQPASGNIARPNTQLKHRSLNALLGLSKGPIGKAQLPSRSPFEERHAHDENEDWQSDRPVKRPRVEVAAGRVSAPRPEKRAQIPLQSRAVNPVKRQHTSADVPQRKSTKEVEVVHLSDEDEPAQNDFLSGFSDDVLRQSSSPSRHKQVNTNATLVGSSSPAFQVQQVVSTSRQRKPQKEVPVMAAISHRLSESIEDLSRLPVNALSKQHRSDTSTPPPEHPAQTATARWPGCDSQRPERSKTGRTLRLPSTGLKKRTLLCQDQVLKKARLAPADVDDAARMLPPEADASTSSDRYKSTSEKLQARLARIAAKKQTSQAPSVSAPGQPRTRNEQPRTVAPIQIDSDEDLPDGPRMNIDEEMQASPAQGPPTSHETSALQLARLDQRMLPPAAPRPRKSIARSVPPSPEPHVARPPCPKEDRQLRRVLSESTVQQSSKPKRMPGAPVRYTPSPTGRSRESTPASGTGSRQVTPVPVTVPGAASKISKPGRPPRSPPDRTAYKKKGPLQKSVSLNMTANGTSTVILSKPFQAPGQVAASSKRNMPEQPKDLGPWSREAFDLFNWRPPGWNEETWCLDPTAAKEGPTTTAASATSTNATAPPPGLSGGAANILPMFRRPVV
ncbi:hypothetical protein Slin14017_G127380 [Septoria linicola]|nr:hypothetical protein Slin14017_G127380 [Septoria linicola]